jgi:hypothetical protein
MRNKMIRLIAAKKGGFGYYYVYGAQDVFDFYVTDKYGHMDTECPLRISLVHGTDNILTLDMSHDNFDLKVKIDYDVTLWSMDMRLEQSVILRNLLFFSSISDINDDIEMKIESDGKLSMGIKGKIQIIISDNDPWIMHIATHGAEMEKDNVIRRNLANNHYISKEGICIRSLYEIMKSMGAYDSNCDESDKLK